MSQKFYEEYQGIFILYAPEDVEASEVRRMLLEGAWDFDVEIAMSVSGKIKHIDSEPVLTKDEDGHKWKTELTIELEFEPWEDLPAGHYNSGDTMDTFSAFPILPEDWEAMGWDTSSIFD